MVTRPENLVHSTRSAAWLPKASLSNRGEISCAFRPNRLLRRAARHAHSTEPRPLGSGCAPSKHLVTLLFRGPFATRQEHSRRVQTIAEAGHRSVNCTAGLAKNPRPGRSGE